MITPKRYEIGCQLLLITNRKSHTGFRLVLTSMTLNDLERRNSPYFAFFSRNSTDFQADYITVVEDRPIMSVKYCLSVPVFYFWRNATCSAVSLAAEHLVYGPRWRLRRFQFNNQLFALNRVTDASLIKCALGRLARLKVSLRFLFDFIHHQQW